MESRTRLGDVITYTGSTSYITQINNCTSEQVNLIYFTSGAKVNLLKKATFINEKRCINFDYDTNLDLQLVQLCSYTTGESDEDRKSVV